MEWAFRIACLITGGTIVLGLLWFNGPSQISGDFAANVAGATVGGFISVGLALWISEKERQTARADAVSNLQEQRKEAIRQTLRHIRAIRDCVKDGNKITINNCQSVRADIMSSISLARIELQDTNLTDFPLRRSMERSIQIGNATASTLIHEIDEAQLQDANLILPSAAGVCNPAVQELNQLMDEYANLRAFPAI